VATRAQTAARKGTIAIPGPRVIVTYAPADDPEIRARTVEAIRQLLTRHRARKAR
jgi:hypothetical protein